MGILFYFLCMSCLCSMGGVPDLLFGFRTNSAAGGANDKEMVEFDDDAVTCDDAVLAVNGDAKDSLDAHLKGWC